MSTRDKRPQDDDEDTDSSVTQSPSSSTGTEPNYIKCGYLSKEGGRVPSWHRRYFKLTRDSIDYYKQNSTNKAEKKAGSIQLAPNATSVTACAKEGRKYCFQVTTSRRIYFLCAEDEADMLSWMEAIKNATTVDTSPQFLLRPGVNSLKLDQKESTEPKISSPTTDNKPLSHSRPSDAEVPSNSPKGPSVDISNGHAGSEGSSHNSGRRDSQTTDTDYDYDFDDVGSTDQNGFRRSTTETDSENGQDGLNGFVQDGGPLFLSQEDEYDIALSAAEIFLKPECDRTPEEQAYVLAMKQYRAQLEEHCKNCGARPEYSFASGTSIFCVREEDRTPIENEYVIDIANEYSEEVKNQQSDRYSKLPLDAQVEIAEGAARIFAKAPQERTEEEQQYVLKMEEYLRDIVRAERQYNVKVKHSLLSSALMLAKYPEERDIEDFQYLEDMVHGKK